MSGKTHIGLLFNFSYTFYRDALCGVRQFVETHTDWIFLPVFVRRAKLCWHGSVTPDGLLATVDNPEFAKAVEGWRQPIVNIGNVLHGLPYPRVCPDHRAIGSLAAQHLLERGLKNLAFVGHPNHLSSEEREAGFVDAAREAGCEVVCYHTRRDRPFDPSARQWYLDDNIHPWLLTLPRPVGIFVPGDIFGAALTHICRELELRVPEDIAVVGADNDDVHGRLASPSLSSVISNAERVGYEAALLLERLLAGEKPPKEPIRVAPGGIHTRRSSEVLAIDDPDVLAAARFIRENAHRPIAVADVLHAVPVSRRALERRFQQALGRGMAQEICRVRLERCKHLLEETDLDISAVAKHSGFASPRHLAATFQREVGEPPSHYRRRTRLRGKDS